MIFDDRSMTKTLDMVAPYRIAEFTPSLRLKNGHNRFGATHLRRQICRKEKMAEAKRNMKCNWKQKICFPSASACGCCCCCCTSFRYASSGCSWVCTRRRPTDTKNGVFFSALRFVSTLLTHVSSHTVRDHLPLSLCVISYTHINTNPVRNLFSSPWSWGDAEWWLHEQTIHIGTIFRWIFFCFSSFVAHFNGHTKRTHACCGLWMFIHCSRCCWLAIASVISTKREKKTNRIEVNWIEWRERRKNDEIVHRSMAKQWVRSDPNWCANPICTRNPNPNPKHKKWMHDRPPVEHIPRLDFLVRVCHCSVWLETERHARPVLWRRRLFSAFILPYFDFSIRKRRNSERKMFVCAAVLVGLRSIRVRPNSKSIPNCNLFLHIWNYVRFGYAYLAHLSI